MNFSLPPKPTAKNLRKSIHKQMLAELDRRKSIPVVATNLAAEICARFSPKKPSMVEASDALAKVDQGGRFSEQDAEKFFLEDKIT